MAERRPLDGWRVLVTRARAQAGPLLDLLHEKGATPLLAPAIAVESPRGDVLARLDDALDALESYDWLVFTSTNAVESVALRLDQRGRGWPAGPCVAAVGRATARVLSERGVAVAFVPETHSSAGLAADLPLREGDRVLAPVGDLADDALAAGLKARGALVDVVTAYHTVADEETGASLQRLLREEKPDAVAFASPSALRNTCAALGDEAAVLFATVVVACIGPTTAAAARAAGLQPRVTATVQTMKGLVEALEEYSANMNDEKTQAQTVGAPADPAEDPRNGTPEAGAPSRNEKGTTASEALFAEAREYIPGGVDSPVRAFKAVGGTPRFIERGEGAYLYDADGNKYIDYVLSYGPLIAGHAPAPIVAALQDAVTRGTSYGAPTRLETELAKRVKRAQPHMELTRFVSSGTEATMSALRVARAYTKRDVIVKVEGGYHGHSDGLLARAGSAAMTLGVPDSPGVPAAVAATTINIPFNDLAALEKALTTFEVAAFIVEPIPANMGVVLPNEDYLKEARRLTQEYGSLLIYDEVITGFRVAFGGGAELYGVEPDLTCLGKIIGGGLPVGAYGGRRAIMSLVAPLGPVYQAGTLSGNPLAMTAGVALLDLLAAPGVYETLDRLSARLHSGLLAQAKAHDVPAYSVRIGSIGTLFFTPGPVTDYATARASNTAHYARFFHGMLERGVYLAPAQFEAVFVALVHDEHDIDATIAAAAEVFTAGLS